MNNKNIPLMLLIFSAVASVIAVVFRSIIVAACVDVHGLYRRGSITPVILHIFLFFCVATVVLIAFRCSSTPEEYKVPQSVPATAISLLTGALFIADAVTVIYNIIVENIPASAFDIAELAFALPAAIFFITIALKPTLSSTALSLVSLFPIAWCAAYLIRVYFDIELLMTDPGRILKQVAVLAAMLAFLNESRAHLGIFSRRFFLAATSSAPILLLSSAIPDILFPDKLMLGSSAGFIKCILCIAFAIFFYLRLAEYARFSAANNSISEQ